ncbi:hypothetical protein K438DRAFT_1948906 [Mycena galopus ATCC 62051]|nr:hypothetical protein K438DRAFT_1948906 [Mycena galopus ATCC 62051]
MTQTDSKEPVLDGTPVSAQTSLPPPYDPLPKEGDPLPNDENEDVDTGTSTRAGNNISINRAFGALKGMRFIVDPNIRLPKSLLPPQPFTVFPKPQLNLRLTVDFGAIDAEVDVLPFNAAPPPHDDRDANPVSALDDVHPRLEKNVHLKASTTTGNIALRVNAPPTAPIALHVKTTFGHVRVYLPRTTHGPLTLSSSLRAARLSPALRRVCTPLREEGVKMDWFVGDIGAWSTKNEVGDEVRIGSDFGSIWVGYVGEEPVSVLQVGPQVPAASASARAAAGRNGNPLFLALKMLGLLWLGLLGLTAAVTLLSGITAVIYPPPPPPPLAGFGRILALLRE